MIKMTHNIYLIATKSILFLFAAFAAVGQQFQTGDLLFQVGSSSGMNDAIATATGQETHIPYTHVGIIYVENDTVFVIEATSPEVTKTLLDAFLLRSAHVDGKPVVTVRRLIEEYREIIPQAIVRAKSLLGKPYDYIFSPDNDAYYCSELVLVSFLNRHGEPIFETISMNFRDADGNLPAFWIEHFEKHNAEIPENRPGSNPVDLSKSDKIEIVKIQTK